jgi:hypothetical protein
MKKMCRASANELSPLKNAIFCDKNKKNTLEATNNEKNTKTSFIVFGFFITGFNMASAKNRCKTKCNP